MPYLPDYMPFINYSNFIFKKKRKTPATFSFFSD